MGKTEFYQKHYDYVVRRVREDLLECYNHDCKIGSVNDIDDDTLMAIYMLGVYDCMIDDADETDCHFLYHPKMEG